MRFHPAPASHHSVSPVVIAGIVVLSLAPWGAAFAQETTGTVQGTVTAPDGTPLAGVEVVATKPAPRVERKAITDRNGGYRIIALPLGEYEITARHQKLEPVKVSQVVVRLGTTTPVPPLRFVAPGTLVERIEVVGKAPLIDPSNTTTGGSVTSSVFDNLPVQRDYQSIATLLPNVSVSYLGDRVLGSLYPIRFHPQADALNYVTRVRTPILMLNGIYDTHLTLKECVEPMYRLLGTPEKDKALKLYPTDHFIPKSELIKETLAWYDKYLGPVRK